MRKEFKFVNNKNEEILIWATKTEHDRNFRNGLMNLWVKHGYLKKFISSTWHLELFVRDNEGNCWNKYNPQIIPGQHKINFNWMLEATEENLIKLINETKLLANI